MIWAILSLIIVFGLGVVLKGPEVSEEEIRTRHLRSQANREYLEKMDPRKFEYLIADLFSSQGYRAQVTPGSNDGGKDIILWKDDEMKFVEVKRYTKESIGRPYIQKLHSAIIDGEAIGGYFVTLSHFNKNARQYAANKNIELIDGNLLIDMLSS
ncbi:restriction endonuclease [Bacillus cereus]|uniref:restriction endonuclease n=1 Tax=Bacillus cereus TaxID=1396 RepID=UPI000BEC8E6D|nr:restriction endonuclease [Bacillus cereus]PEC77390.1 restriction endonuclease [Bacillus cereus]PFS94582.1 restriction endonuclease [Bacillus cereus]